VAVPGPWSFLLPSVVSIAIVWAAFAVTDDVAAQLALIAAGVMLTLGAYAAYLWRRRRTMQRDE
jgi:hypothetical protein